MIQHVVLLGLMGAGKTTVGAELAATLGWPLRDSDADVLAATGRTARELDTELGTAELHRLETGHLIDALAAPGRTVICAAASTVDDPAGRSALGGRGLLLVWLRATPATLVRRSRTTDPDGRGRHRRDLGPDLTVGLAAQAADRYPRFESLHPLIVDVEDASASTISAAIAAHLEDADR